MSNNLYLHGYSDEEQQRLITQNEVLAKFIYRKIDLDNHYKVLEIGCGVGAQMIYMLDHFQHLHLTGLELEQKQLDKAANNLKAFGIPEERYALVKADATHLGQMDLKNFDAVIMIWVLEHIDTPLRVIKELSNNLNSGTTLYITEVFHRSFHVHPYNEHLDKFWRQMMDFQEQSGGDANVGLKLGDYLYRCGFKIEWIEPFPVFFDVRNPENRREMLKYWLELSKSAIPGMREAGVFDEEVWHKAEAHMHQLLADENAVFYYSFMQAKATMP